MMEEFDGRDMKNSFNQIVLRFNSIEEELNSIRIEMLDRLDEVNQEFRKACVEVEALRTVITERFPPKEKSFKSAPTEK